MKITIGGPAGTGKGTVGRMLGEHYGYEFVSGGDLFRKAAEKNGMTMEEFDILMKSDPNARVDEQIDKIQADMSKSSGGFVLESRLGWHFAPNSIKVKVDCELDERIRRITNDDTGHRIAYSQESLAETKVKTLQRAEDHQARITEIYGIKDMIADEHFDFVVDSTSLTAQEVTQKIIDYITENYVK